MAFSLTSDFGCSAHTGGYAHITEQLPHVRVYRGEAVGRSIPAGGFVLTEREDEHTRCRGPMDDGLEMSRLRPRRSRETIKSQPRRQQSRSSAGRLRNCGHGSWRHVLLRDLQSASKGNDPLTLAGAGGFGQRAPFKVHDVAQVVVTPFSHLIHASTHCLRSFGL